MSDLISVIVPVYNSAWYLRGCVQSVVRQTYRDIEVLLIDDGSTDRSRDICKSMSIEDKRIKIILQTHQGVSAARNKGIKASKGKYLFFLDVDDIIHPQLLEELYSLLEKTGATIATESRYYATEGEFQKPKEWETENNIVHESICLDSEKAIEFLIRAERNATLYVIGGKMLCREKIGRVRFNESLTHGEDTLFLYQLLENGANVTVLYHDWYYYRIYKGSATSIFTVPACQSRYQAERYIRNHEIRSGRLSNAVHWEGTIVRAMIAWYEAGRSKRDKSLMLYVRNLAKYEKNLKIFSKIERADKFKFYFMFYCYPFYYVFSAVRSCMRVCSKIKRFFDEIRIKGYEKARM